MKLAKKFMALALAAVLSVGCTFCVSAEGSRTKDVTVSQEQSEIYEIVQKIENTDNFKKLEETVPAVAEAFKEVGAGTMDVKGFVDVLKALVADETDDTIKAAIEEVIEKLDGKDFVTGFTEFKVKDLAKAEKNPDGKYEVEIAVPSITDDMENVQLLCYNPKTNKWTVIDPISIDKENKTIKVALDEDCYFTVIADAKADTAE